MARRRAAVLVNGPVAPYSRAIRIARALAAEGFDVEIAATAGAGLAERETIAGPQPGSAGLPEPVREETGHIEIRRYRPRGRWRWLGASNALSGSIVTSTGPGRWAARSETAGVARREMDDVSGHVRLVTGRRPVAPGSRAARRLVAAIARPVLALRRWVFWPHPARGWWATLSSELRPAELYHACGIAAVPAALAARDRAADPTRIGRVVYDAIDDIVGSNDVAAMPALVRARITRLERSWAGRCDVVITVNDVLAERLAARLGRGHVDAIPNYPEPAATQLAPARPGSGLRAAAGLGEGTRIVLFQGRLGPGLGLEAAAAAMLEVDNAALVLLGFGRGIGDALARDRDPRLARRHRTLPAVPPDNLLAWTTEADLMLIPLPPLSTNQRNATPNKFWEALAAGLPVVVVRGLTVLERLVVEHDLGIVAVSGSATDLAAAIRTVLARLDRDGPAWRREIAALSAAEFSWPPVATRYRQLVRSLMTEARADG